MRIIQALVQPGDVVWDVGAHHGYMSLCAAARVGMEGEVHAFEPSARNRRILERHIRWNRGLRMVAHPYALSSFDGEARFGGGATSKSSALDGGLERVNVRTGASLIASLECPSPSFLKLDVEDAEGDVIEGLGTALPSDARLLIAVHSEGSDRKCCDLLERRGFALMPSPALLECRRDPWTADPDLLCIGPDYIGRERMRDAAQRMGFSR
jgi:FkbM family methyltransferase